VKILYTPNLIVPSLSPDDRSRIMAAAGEPTTLVETKDPARQRVEIVDADVLFGRVAPATFASAKKLFYYHSLGAGVDAILTPELVDSDVVLASEKGEVGIHLAEHAFALLLTLTRGLHTAGPVRTFSGMLGETTLAPEAACAAVGKAPTAAIATRPASKIFFIVHPRGRASRRPGGPFEPRQH